MRSHAKAVSAIAAIYCGLFLCLGAASASASSQVITWFGTEVGTGTLGAQFNNPRDVAVNNTGAGPANEGDIYVVDDNNNRIQRFDKDGNFISAWGADVDATPTAGNDFEICTLAAACKAGVASAGNGTTLGNGNLDNPQSVAVDNDTGDVYVSDRDNRRINRYDGEGKFIASFGFDVDATTAGTGYEVCPATDVCKIGVAGAGVGQMGSVGALVSGGPLGIAVSPSNGEAAVGKVFLADTTNRRVNTYNLDGTSPASFGSAANFGLNQPKRITVDSRGIVYASDSNGANEIDRYDSEGAVFLTSIATRPCSPEWRETRPRASPSTPTLTAPERIQTCSTSCATRPRRRPSFSSSAR